MSLNSEAPGRNWVHISVGHALGPQAAHEVDGAISKARAAGVPWMTIFTVLLPLILGLLGGQPVDVAKLIEAILGLVKSKP